MDLGQTTEGLTAFSAYVTFTNIDPAKNHRRFYSLSWQYNLWGQLSLVRTWGRIGAPGRSCADTFADKEAARATVERAIRRRLQRGYTVTALG